MNRKELQALFCEVSSRCAPIRGIYSAPPTEREQIIQHEMQMFLQRELKKKEAQSLTHFFEQKVAQIQSKEELIQLLQTLQQSYHPKEIPDTIYIHFMKLAHTYHCTELMPEYFHS
uniref:Uncharacterized protein n=1 Tax=Roseihalotalea indica TaxID=2867963 RepID=A0AA49GP69_9BACT|nr:hypothetical protein K4G66_25900 [Tunicatimonas sp. TK19036]